jgi:hypothetical protein
VDGIEEVITFNRGTRVGNPLGDILFGVTMSKLLNELESRLQAEGLLPNIPWNGTSTPFHSGDAPAHSLVDAADPSYVDDVALLVSRRRPHHLITCIQRTVAGKEEVFKGFGMRLNYSPGKKQL